MKRGTSNTGYVQPGRTAPQEVEEKEYNGPMYGGATAIQGHMPDIKKSESFEKFMRSKGGVNYTKHTRNLNLNTAKEAFEFIKKHDAADQFTQRSQLTGYEQAVKELDFTVAEMLNGVRLENMEKQKLVELRRKGIPIVTERFEKNIKPLIESLLKEFQELDTIPGFKRGELIKFQTADLLKKMKWLLHPNSDGYISYQFKED